MVAQDGSEAVLAYVRLVVRTVAAHPGLVRLPGLDPVRQYTVRVREDVGMPAVVQAFAPGWLADGVTLSGAVLGEVGSGDARAGAGLGAAAAPGGVAAPATRVT